MVAAGLAPATLYAYTARSGADAASATFATCPPPGEPLVFAVYGDSRDDPALHAAVLARLAAEAPDLVVHTGDVVAGGTRDAYLTEFFPATAGLFARVPVLVAIGNHDLYTALDQGFGTVFPLAADGQGTRRTWGAVTCGNVLFLALDSNAPGDAAQLAFLDAALAAARVDGRVDHVFPVFHHPPYSSGDYHGDDLIVRETFGARFADPASKVSRT